MLSFLKKLFGGSTSAPAAPAAPPPPSPSRPSKPAPAAAAAPAAPAAPAIPAPTAAPSPAPAAPAAGPQETLALPLKNIVEQLPEELKAGVASKPESDVTVAIPLKVILEGLPRGAVKVSFGDVRRAAPPGVFAEATSSDQTIIQLPLKDILARIKPEHLAAKRQQKTIEIPDDIKPVFGSTGRAAETSAPPPAPTPAPARPVPTPAPTPAPKAPAAPVAPAPQAPIKPVAPLPTPAAAPVAPRPATAAPAAEPAGQAGKVEGDKLVLPFAAVTLGLPEALKAEVGSLAQANLVLNMGELEPMMKKGRVSFPWKQLRAQIQPAPSANLGAAQDATAVDIPLKLLIPHFMAARKPAPAQKQVTVDQNIPDVFAGKAAAPAPAPAPAPTPAPSLTPAVTAPAAPTPAVPASKLGQLFGQPSKSGWTPAEIVQATTKLGGVGGALIATHDGLSVACQLPPSLNGEAMSGFLPEIFNRINQYTKDLKLGETNSIAVRVGTQPLEIRRAGKVYFAALGQPGQSLPADKLGAIAAELEQQHK